MPWYIYKFKIDNITYIPSPQATYMLYESAIHYNGFIWDTCPYLGVGLGNNKVWLRY